MSVEPEAQQDLSVSSQDAENVTGGRMLNKLRRKSKTAKKQPIIHPTPVPTHYSDEPAVDPVADEYGPSGDTATSSGDSSGDNS